MLETKPVRGCEDDRAEDVGCRLVLPGGEVARAAAMVRVGVSIDDHLETASEVRQHRNIPIEVIAHRVNQRGDMIAFGICQIGLALGVIQFAKRHRNLSWS